MPGWCNGSPLGLHPRRKGSIPLPGTKIINSNTIRNRRIYNV